LSGEPPGATPPIFTGAFAAVTFRARDAAGHGRADDVFLHRGADELELPGVELDPGLPQDLAQHERPVELPYREAVRLGHFVDVVGRDEAPGPGHVLDDERRVAGNVLAHVPRDHPGVRVEAASGSQTHDDPHGPAFEEGLSLRGPGAERGERDEGRRQCEQPAVHVALP
jgi:hypothetical protein